MLIQTAEDLHQGDLLDERLSKQLHNELLATMRKPDGTEQSAFYYTLPAEIRAEIFSYLVVVPDQIHVFAPHDNDQHGYRLSLCGESAMDQDFGRCSCENGRPFSLTVPTYTPDFLDTALLLVRSLVWPPSHGRSCSRPFLHTYLSRLPSTRSQFHDFAFLCPVSYCCVSRVANINASTSFKVSKSVRREVMDVLFMRNHFTFTSLRDVVSFSSLFRTSASKLQHIRIYDRADDYRCPDFKGKQIEKARR